MTSRDETGEARATIDDYLTTLAMRLTVEPAERATILEEIRGHLEEAAAAGAAHGATSAEAESQAIAAFGSARETARAFNAALPVYWDLRRMLLGIVQGVVAIWGVWTLATFPFVVQMAAERQLELAMSTAPATLLFVSSPLGFGLFDTLRNGPWAVLLLLALFGAIAFALGSRASSGWRAGFAFGLGVIFGLPFLPVSLLPWHPSLAWTLLPTVITIWLLMPYAIFAARLGARFARIRERRSIRDATIPAPRRRGVSRVALAGLVVSVTLLGVNGWSFVRALTPAPAAMTSSVAQELANTQTELPFTIRQPGYLPDGMALSRVIPAVSDCNPCVAYTVVILQYRNSHGGWIELTEQSHPLPVASATPDFTYSSGPLISTYQEWWLGPQEKTEQQVTLAWNDGTLDYILSANMQMSQPMLERIARSVTQ